MSKYIFMHKELYHIQKHIWKNNQDFMDFKMTSLVINNLLKYRNNKTILTQVIIVKIIL